MEYEKGSYVAVVNGTVDSDGIIAEDVSICVVLQVGENDLLVTPAGSPSSSPVKHIISKDNCVLVKVDHESLTNKPPRLPKIGDMVAFQDKLKWSDREDTTVVGTVYEISYRFGRPSTATVMVGTDMMKLPFDNLLVLQTSGVK